MTDNLPSKSNKSNVESILTDKQLSLLDNLSIYRSWYDAAINSGYSEKTSRNIKALVQQSPRFIQAMRKRYNGKTAIQLHEIGLIEDKVIQTCLDDVENVPKYKHTLKEIKQSAGVLAPEQTSGSGTININSVQNLMVKLNDEITSRYDNE